MLAGAVLQVIDTARGKGLADEYGIRFLETSAKTGAGVEDAFITLAKDIKKRLIDSTEKPIPPEGGGPTVQLNGNGTDPSKGAAKKNCCG
jgi:Ras-related protein Rab-8A